MVQEDVIFVLLIRVIVSIQLLLTLHSKIFFLEVFIKLEKSLLNDRMERETTMFFKY